MTIHGLEILVTLAVLLHLLFKQLRYLLHTGSLKLILMVPRRIRLVVLVLQFNGIVLEDYFRLLLAGSPQLPIASVPQAKLRAAWEGLSNAIFIYLALFKIIQRVIPSLLFFGFLRFDVIKIFFYFWLICFASFPLSSSSMYNIYLERQIK